MSDTTYQYAPPKLEFVDFMMSALIQKAPPALAPLIGYPGNTRNEGNGSSSLGSQPLNDCPKDFTGFLATIDCTSYMYCQNGVLCHGWYGTAMHS